MSGATESLVGSHGQQALEHELEESLRDIGIPPRPLILDQIDAEMREAEPDFRRLAALISADVALAAGLLKTANSPYFGFHARARTVTQALVILGLDVAARAVAGLVMRRVFPTVPAMERFWDASARVARTAGWLVSRLGVKDGVKPGDAYTYGLFRDCGIPILLRKFPDYTHVLRLANNEPEALFTIVELEHCPTNHSVVGGLMAQNWWLPDEMVAAIRCHHDPLALESGSQGILPASARLVALAQLAEHLVQRITRQSATREWEKLGHVCRQLLAIDAVGVEMLAREAHTVVSDAFG